MKHVFIIAIVAVAMIGVMVPSVFAQYMGNVGSEIEVRTDYSNYSEGSLINISGTVPTIIGDTKVSLQLFLGGNLVEIAQIPVSATGHYSYALMADGNIWKNPGEVLVTVSYGEDNIAKTYFDYVPTSLGYNLGIYPLLVSVSIDEKPGNESSYSPNISGNGQFVVFASDATNLVDTDENYQRDIFVRDVLNEKTELVSISSDGSQGAYPSTNPSISSDGRYVVFNTNSNLDPDVDENSCYVYMRDRLTSKTICVTKHPSNEISESVALSGNNGIISSDGRYVVFNLPGYLGNNESSIGNLFVWDRVSLSITALPVYTTNDFNISGNGEKISFINKDGGIGGAHDLFVYDRNSGKTTHVSERPVSEFYPPGQGSYLGTMDFEGNQIVFISNISDLVDNDYNDDSSVFLYDMTTSKIKLISINPNNESFSTYSSPQITDDGKFILMHHSGSLIYDVEAEKTIRGSTFGGVGNISDNAEFITFVDDQIYVTTINLVSDSSTTADKHSEQNEISSDNTSLTIDKIIYHPGELIKISGVVEDSQKGIQVKIILTNPDGTNTGLTIYPNSDGEYSTIIQINSEYELGEYGILSSYNSKILGKEKFSIQIKSQNNYDEPVAEATPEATPEPAFAESQTLSTDKGTLDVKLSYEDVKPGELTRLPIEFINPMTQKTQVHVDYKIMITESGETIFQTRSFIHTSEGIINGFKFEFPQGGTYNMKIGVVGILFTPIAEETVSFDIVVGESKKLGIASFVDQTKDPQHYIDRYNNEPSYKEWFDENYPQYSSIYQAVGLEEPVAEYTSEPVAEVISTPNCGAGTQLVNGICKVIQTEEKSSGGGCLIATATYGSELALQVQQLRELRDNQLLNTESGTAFMATFNDIYYSFSPTIADMEREHPMFKEAVKLAITPMISSLSLMENANSESEVLGIGISVIMLNLGMYLGIPAVVIVGIRKRF